LNINATPISVIVNDGYVNFPSHQHVLLLIYRWWSITGSRGIYSLKGVYINDRWI